MAERSRLVFPLVAVALMAALAWWAFEEPAPRRIKDAAGVAEPRAAYYVRDFTLTATGDDGAVAYRVRGPSAAYFEAEASWHVRTPVWTVLSEGGSRWEGRAHRARIRKGGEFARLTGDVRLHRRGGTQAPLTVRTEAVDLYPKRDYAETAKPVTITGEHLRVRGIGARLWFDEERMQLLADVEGHYEPPR